jgi:tetratricopeptide (TPR) repeat protein
LLASVYQRSANAAAFDTTYEQAVRHFEKLRELKPDDLDTVSDLGAIHAVRAVHLQQNIGTPEARLRALDSYRRSLDVMRPSYEKNPLHLTLASTYGRVQGFAGLLLTMLGRPHESQEYHRRAVEISTALVSRDPGDARARAEQAEAHGRLGGTLRQVGDLVGAVDHATQAVALLEGLPELTRAEVVVEFNRAVARVELGKSLEALAARHTDRALRRADLALACTHYREAERLLEGNLKRRPANRMTQETSTDVRQGVSRCAKVRPAG